MKLTMGIDEAGRGPVLGPMVMAAVVLTPAAAGRLTRGGVRDSKSFGAGTDAHQARCELAKLVLAHAAHTSVQVIDVVEIDRRVRCGELNCLEREVATRFIRGAPRVHRIVADGRSLFGALSARFSRLEACNEAESKHVSVAAASILAKVRRDELFAAIAERYAPDFGTIAGGGYANAATRRFLRAYAERHRALPPEARRSWPFHYLHDLLGADFDPFADRPEAAPPQLALL